MRININDILNHASRNRRRCIDVTNAVEIGPPPYELNTEAPSSQSNPQTRIDEQSEDNSK